MSARLDGRVAIIIGAARGIGFGIARRFVAEGARVIVGDTDMRGNDTVAGLGSPEVAAFLETDISRAEHAERIVAEAMRRFGRLDILVQNAGIYPWTLIENISPEEWDSVLGSTSKAVSWRRRRR